MMKNTKRKAVRVVFVNSSLRSRVFEASSSLLPASIPHFQIQKPKPLSLSLASHQMDAAEPPPSSYKPTSTLFKDISNFKTPKRPSRISEFQSPCPQFFTATKQTPRTNSSFRRRPPPSSARTNAVRKLKAVELEQSQSSRKVQIRKEQSLKSLAKSLTVWLNFLFENPRSCGCNFPVDEDHGQTLRKGKRDRGSGVQVRVDAAWRDPKRQRDSSWRGEDSEGAVAFSISKYSKLQSSLKLLCSFDDLILRMRFHLSLGSCQEVFDSMIQVAKVLVPVISCQFCYVWF